MASESSAGELKLQVLGLAKRRASLWLWDRSGLRRPESAAGTQMYRKNGSRAGVYGAEGPRATKVENFTRAAAYLLLMLPRGSLSVGSRKPSEKEDLSGLVDVPTGFRGIVSGTALPRREADPGPVEVLEGP